MSKFIKNNFTNLSINNFIVSKMESLHVAIKKYYKQFNKPIYKKFYFEQSDKPEKKQFYYKQFNKLICKHIWLILYCTNFCCTKLCFLTQKEIL